jgi:AcrR family transcriptional regulator
LTVQPGRPPAREGAPHGEDEVRGSLLEAASELFAARGPAGVSVRQIATRAGVNHGLVHYYFGSKAGLLAAVLDRCAADVADELTQADGAALVTRSDSAVVRHTRILAHVILGSEDPAAIQHEFPTQRRLITAIKQRGLPDRAARERAAQVSALVLGWHLFGDFLTDAVGLRGRGPTTDAVLRDAVARLLS